MSPSRAGDHLHPTLGEARGPGNLALSMSGVERSDDRGVPGHPLLCSTDLPLVSAEISEQLLPGSFDGLTFVPTRKDSRFAPERAGEVPASGCRLEEPSFQGGVAPGAEQAAHRVPSEARVVIDVQLPVRGLDLEDPAVLAAPPAPLAEPAELHAREVVDVVAPAPAVSGHCAGRLGAFAPGLRRYQRTSSLITAARLRAPTASPSSRQVSSSMRIERTGVWRSGFRTRVSVGRCGDTAQPMGLVGAVTVSPHAGLRCPYTEEYRVHTRDGLPQTVTAHLAGEIHL